MITEVFTYEEVGGSLSRRDVIRTDLGPTTYGPVTWFTQQFTWTELGDIASVSYPVCEIPTECAGAGNPSGQPSRTVTYGYSNGFLSSVGGFATSIAYHPNEMLASIVHPNGVSDVWDNDPDSMGRPARVRTTGVVSATNFDTGAYAYDGTGNITAMGADAFAYDGVSRLVSATALQGQFGETATYDAFGNRTAATTGPVGTRSIPTDPATNRLLGTTSRPISYDGRGNQIQWGTAAFTYDPLDKLIRQDDSGSGDDYSYVYTADDERILVIDNDIPSETWTIRDLDGLVLRKFFRLTGDTDWVKDAIHRQGHVLATDTAGTGVHHAHLDHLGTIRLWTRPNGTVFSRHDYTAFGEEIVDTLDNQDHRYTGHERDILRSGGCSGTTTVNNQTLSTGQTITGCTEVTSSNTSVTSTQEVRFRAGEVISFGDGFEVASNAVFVAELDGSLQTDLQDLDYMHARYCSPQQGRFLSLDPHLGEMRRPQTWNRYAYAIGNPMKWTDPTGEVISLERLSEEQRQILIEKLNEFTGNTYAVNDNAELVLEEIGSSSSSAATSFINSAIDSDNTYTVLAGNATLGSAKPFEDTLTLDFRDFVGPKADIQYGSVPQAALDLGAVFFHELIHAHYNFHDPKTDLERQAQTGLVVGLTNLVRTQRGLPTRGPAYAGTMGIRWRVRFNFQGVNPKKPQKKYWVRARDVTKGPQPYER